MKRTMLITVVFCVPVASFLIFTADSFLDGTPQPIKLISGSLSESFKIQAVLLTSIDPNKIPVPVEVNLFFKSTLSTKDKDGNVYTFSLDLKLKHGDVQFIK